MKPAAGRPVGPLTAPSPMFVHTFFWSLVGVEMAFSEAYFLPIQDLELTHRYRQSRLVVRPSFSLGNDKEIYPLR